MDNEPESRLIVSINSGRVFITVFGEGCVREAMDLKKQCQEALAKGLSDFTFELKDCTGVDETFLGILLGLGLKLKARQGELRIVNARPEISRLMLSLGFDRLFSLG